MSRKRILLSALALAAAASFSHGATLVNDTWRDGTDSDPASPVYSENGVDADADLDLESAWFQGGAGSLDPVGSGRPTAREPSLWRHVFGFVDDLLHPEANQVTLAQGERLRAVMTFTLTNVNTTNTSQSFRFAMTNTTGSARITANAAPNNDTYTGYSIFGNMGQTLGNSSPFQLRERTVLTSSDLLATSGNWTSIGNGATSGATGFTAGTTYTLAFDLFHNLSDGLDIDVRITGGNLDTDGIEAVTLTDATPSSFTYDTFALRPSGATTTAELIDITSFRVDYTAVPEPTACGLLLAGATALLRRRK